MILEAAERVFAKDSNATLAEVAAVAGVDRTTVHRRFSSREQLIAALAESVDAKLRDAVRRAITAASPPREALRSVTIATMELKLTWRFGLDASGSPAPGGVAPDVLGQLDVLLGRLADEGVLRRGVDIVWARSVYLALVHEVARLSGPADLSPVARADLVLDTLLDGLGAGPTAEHCGRVGRRPARGDSTD